MYSEGQMSSAPTMAERHNKDVDYYETHYQELLALYPDQWIAISIRRWLGRPTTPLSFRPSSRRGVYRLTGF